MTQKEATKEDLEKTRNFLSEFFLTFGIAITVGVMFNFSVENLVNGSLLILGVTSLLIGSHMRFVKINVEKLNSKSFRIFRIVLNAFSFALLIGFSVLFLFFRLYYWSMIFVILAVIIGIFLYLIKKSDYSH